MINPRDIDRYDYEGGDGHHCEEAWITWAVTKDGHVLSDEELDELNAKHLYFFHQEIMEDSVGSMIDRAMDMYED